MAGPVNKGPQAPVLPQSPASPQADQSPAVEADKPDSAAQQATEDTPQLEIEGDNQELTARERSDPGLRRQQAGRKPQTPQRQTEFKQTPEFMRSGQLPKQIGHKIQTQRQPQQARQPNTQEQGSNQTRNQGSMAQRTVSAERRPQRPIPERPNSESYKQILNERPFRGPLRDTPLHKKLQNRAIRQQAQQHARAQQERAPEAALERGEIVQLFRMRNKATQKERLRAILKHEIAKARQEARQKVQGNKFKTDKHSQSEEIEQGRFTKLDAAKNKISQRLQNSQRTSKFEQILQKVLKGGKPVPDLPDGVKARFATKTNEEWSEFFKNITQNGSQFQNEKGQLSKLIESLFRGLKKDGGQNQMVSDMTFTHDGEVLENKFSQLNINDPKLLAKLEKLTPGDPIPQQLMEEFGKEFEFLKLVHIVESLVLTEEQKKAALKQLKQQHSSESQKRFEKALIDQRNENAKRDSGPDPFVHASIQPKETNRAKGSTKIFLYLLYGVGAIMTILILFILGRAIF